MTHEIVVTRPWGTIQWWNTRKRRCKNPDCTNTILPQRINRTGYCRSCAARILHTKGDTK